MAHKELTDCAARWLRNTLHCRVVCVERMAATTRGETADCIGWVGGGSILVEVKVSLADYRRDQRKYFRSGCCRGLGDYRFYVTPEGLLSGEVIPQGWGWYELRGNRICHAGGVRYANAHHGPFHETVDKRSEIAVLLAEMVAREKEAHNDHD